MYQVGGWLDYLRSERRGTSGVRVLAPNVLFLGLTSLLTDISSEMVVSVLPIYLVGFLRLSPVQFGFIDGLYQGVGALVQVGAGVITDRLGRHKEVAGFGYSVSALSRIGLLMTSTWTGIAGLLAVDRLGKGMRTAPRDALLSLSGRGEDLGLVFGVHRAMDALGAMLGPIAAFVILQRIPNAFDVVFVASLAVAVIGVAVLFTFVENRAEPISRSQASLFTTGAGLFRERSYRHLAVAALLLGTLTISDAFVYLTLQRQGHVPSGAFPLLFVATSACYLLLAVPIGRFADRIGRYRVFVGGHMLLVGLYVALTVVPPGLGVVVLTLALLGAYYAATDGVLMALGSEIVAANVRTSGLAILTTTLAIARFGGSVLFGICWSAFGVQRTVVGFAVGLTVAIAVVATTWPGRTR